MRVRRTAATTPLQHMNGLAKIIFTGGERLMPARNGYDRELVFDEAEFCARRHGSVGVQLGRKEMRISLSAAELIVGCARCRKPVGTTSFVIERVRVCSSCARRWMSAATR